MKRISTFLVIFSILTVGNSQEYYTYYGGEKRYFNVSPNKILVHVAENANTDTIKSVIAKNTSFVVSDVRKTAYNGLKVVSLSGTDTTTTRSLVKQLRNKKDILYSAPIFVNERGEEIAALTNRVVVRLKQVFTKNSNKKKSS